MKTHFLARAWLIITTAQTECTDELAATRAQTLVDDYQVSDAELAGFNQAAGTQILSITSSRGDRDPRIDVAEGITEVTMDLNLEIRLNAETEAEAEKDIHRAFGLFDLNGQFLAGYNQKVGADFSHFEVVQIVSIDIRPAPASR